MEEKKEEYILVAVGREEDTAVSLRELADLLETAGGKAVDFVTQNLPHPDPATYLGSGKAEELRWIMEEEGAVGIVCDDELSPAQLKYRSSHLTGMGKALSRLGGGIGTRGPGETKLETDRRVIKSRISSLSEAIRDMKRVRETTRKTYFLFGMTFVLMYNSTV